MMKVWITKYALTEGIFAVEAKSHTPSMVSYTLPGTYMLYAHGKDWHMTLESAMAQAEEMRKRKMLSLERAALKLAALKIKVKEAV